ncbi:Fur family transcriptional regulator [Flavobacterium johnsoniae]|uniref:Fur family transcriptional regulator, ferric uptake regulator n=2 Tax=Flavobacterium TaxID=237 RepID=A0A1M5VUQ9_FLAJO|nr:transcriptional repressor [Flavobacterium johnsoniae]SHH79029.1 Fur family transcriptional regulator, ferric uptake regulator [Flavobacterium johnsoniae]
MKKTTEEAFNGKGIRPTTMRILIYEYMETLTAALSLAEIEKYFHKADKVTIYRTLQTFLEKGLVHKIMDDSQARYRLCADSCEEEEHNDRHLHFYCRRCGQTTCREEIMLPESLSGSLQIDEIQILAKGICEKCLTAK